VDPFRVPLPTIPVDDMAYVWWYDNEGSIQSHGINFVQDLPYFLVLLLCFDCFTPTDWGIITLLQPAATSGRDSNCCRLSIPSSPSAIEVDIEYTGKIQGHFGIKGRATQVFNAQSGLRDP